MMWLVSSEPRYAELVAELGRREAQVRRHDPEGVHRARVACRRLRALLVTYRLADELVGELRWLGQELSPVRDRYVVHQLLSRMLLEEPRGAGVDAAGRRIERSYGGTLPVPEAFGSPRYAALRSALDALEVTRPDPATLRGRVRADVERVQRRHAHSRTDAGMHDLRKAAKRLRYAAELWAPEGGGDAGRVVRAATRLTQHLGERQDTVLLREHLLRLADAAARDGEPSFTYGRLHARAQARAEALDAAMSHVWKRFTGPATRSTC